MAVRLSLAWIFCMVMLLPSSLLAETVTLKRQGEFCEDDPACHNRFHWAIPPAKRADPGDVLVYETRDAFDHAFDRTSDKKDVLAANLNLVHPITGPIHIRGAEPGDVLAVKVLDIKPDDFGYTIVVPGFGFLRDLFPDPHIVRWDLNRLEATSPDLPGVRIPNESFIGTIAVAPGPDQVDRFLSREEAIRKQGGFALPPEPQDAQPSSVCGPDGDYKNECLRTVPPRENGGNMDSQQMQIGTTLYLPVFTEGALLSMGDVHYAQGDGEVSGTAIEMDATVTVKVKLLKDRADRIRQPHVRGGSQLVDIAPTNFYATIGYPVKPKDKLTPQLKFFDGKRLSSLENVPEDVTLAARDALLQMIDWLVHTKGLTREQAYVLCSDAVDLRITQLVDVPNFAVVAVLPLNVFDDPDKGMNPSFNRLDNVHQ